MASIMKRGSKWRAQVRTDGINASAVDFDVATDHKIDSRAAGRYLSYKMTLGATDYKDFEFSGFDIDVTQTGAR